MGTPEMSNSQFRAFLDLLMVSDPWPLESEQQEVLLTWAAHESQRRGYDGWIDAYHHFKG